MTQQPRPDYVLSFYRVRQALGFLGLAFPLLLFLGGLLADARVHPSISDYYHTALRDLYVGTLFAIGIFLVSYKGHPRGSREWLSDNLASTLAGVGAFGLAIFPNQLLEAHLPNFAQRAFGVGPVVALHFVSAVLFLGAMAYICLAKFTQTARPARRRIYRFCGFAIILFGVAATVASIFRGMGPDWLRDWINLSGFIFWCEAMGIWAFGLSWLVKGQADLALLRGVARVTGRAGP